MEKKIIILNNDITLSNVYRFISQIIYDDKKGKNKEFLIRQEDVLHYLKNEYVIQLDKDVYQGFKHYLQYIRGNPDFQIQILNLLQTAELAKNFRRPIEELKQIMKIHFLDYRFGLLGIAINEYKDYNKSDIYFIKDRYKEKQETWDIINEIITTTTICLLEPNHKPLLIK